MSKPLENVRVIDLSRVLAGPFCAQLLADMGADVIKIESPEGDENRRWPPMNAAGESCNFASVNRGKRGMTLNLKSPQARDILYRLCADADVLIHSFLPETGLRLGVDEAALRAANPGLIICSISGYGAEGALRNKAGYDLMVQAFSGVMSMTGYEDSPPIRTGISFIDMSTGLSAYSGILTAIISRQQSGAGSAVRASLLETAIALTGYHAVAWLQAGVLPQRQGSGAWHLVPYQAFRCRDGWLLAGAPNDAAWRRLCEALDLPELGHDARFQVNQQRVAERDTLVPLLEARFLQGDAADWVARLEANGVAAAPLQTLDEVMSHPQVLANKMVVEAQTADGRMTPLVGTPFKLAEAGTTSPRAAPALGADTEAILEERLGLSQQDVAVLRRQGAL